MGVPRTAQGRDGRRRMKKRRCERPLIFQRELDNVAFLDRLPRRLVCRRDDEVADATPLDFGGAFHRGERVGRDAGFEPGGTGLRCRHTGNVRCFAGQGNGASSLRPPGLAHGVEL